MQLHSNYNLKYEFCKIVSILVSETVLDDLVHKPLAPAGASQVAGQKVLVVYGAGQAELNHVRELWS